MEGGIIQQILDIVCSCLLIFICAVIVFFYIFSIGMLMDAWRHAETSWFILLSIGILVPFMLFFIVGIFALCSPCFMPIMRAEFHFGDYVPIEPGPGFLAIALFLFFLFLFFSFIILPLIFGFEYYRKKYASIYNIRRMKKLLVVWCGTVALFLVLFFKFYYK